MTRFSGWAPPNGSEKRPPWWPEGESWPPQSSAGAEAWTGFGRRLARLAAVWFALVILLPLLVGVVLAVTIGGWTSVVVALLSWVGIGIVLVIGVRAGLRFWSPVRSLVDTAGRLAEGDYTARAEPTSRPPVRHVVESFNRMAERLEHTERGRRQLLADVGHEIRTPLTIIRGELEAMADGVHTPDPDQLRRLLGDVDVVERLLDDLATLSQAEAGMLTVHREPTDVVALLQEAVDGQRSAASAAGVDVTLAAADDEIEADVDPIRLKEVVTNLLANGLRATPPGGRVEAAVTIEDDELTIVIVDTGHGMPAAELDQVFERFHKGHGSDGSGLGLTISRDLVRAHGGELTLTSGEGIGTTATVSLPLDP